MRRAGVAVVLRMLERDELARAPALGRLRGDLDLNHAVDKCGARARGAGARAAGDSAVACGLMCTCSSTQPLSARRCTSAARQAQAQRVAFDAQLHGGACARAARARMRCARSRCGRSSIWPSRLSTPACGAAANAAMTARARAISCGCGLKAALIGADLMRDGSQACRRTRRAQARAASRREPLGIAKIDAYAIDGGNVGGGGGEQAQRARELEGKASSVPSASCAQRPERRRQILRAPGHGGERVDYGWSRTRRARSSAGAVSVAMTRSWRCTGGQVVLALKRR